MNEGFVMDSWRDFDVISNAYTCLLLWPKNYIYICIDCDVYARSGHVCQSKYMVFYRCLQNVLMPSVCRRRQKIRRSRRRHFPLTDGGFRMHAIIPRTLDVMNFHVNLKSRRHGGRGFTHSSPVLTYPHVGRILVEDVFYRLRACRSSMGNCRISARVFPRAPSRSISP